MKVPKKEDIPHKLALYKLLQAILSNPITSNNLSFKGGTCASMLGYLDRFSVDLDFDLRDKSKREVVKSELRKIINEIGFEIKDESVNHVQFFMKYRDTVNERNTLKLDVSDLVSEKNKYEKSYLIEIDKYCNAQTIDTMFANKLVALKARWDEGKGVSGRDLYDIHYFFNKSCGINREVIEDIRGVSFADYIQELIIFITKEISDRLLFEDLNPLLSKDKLNTVIPYLKSEVLIALKSL